MNLRSDVTVFYIARNEDKWIGKSLEIAQNFVDNIVVVDTGSTDNTIDIVRQTEAKLIEHKEYSNENFSRIKNHYADEVHTDLTFFVDGNEIVSNLGYEKIAKVINQVKWEYFPIFSIPSFEVLEIKKTEYGMDIDFYDWPRHRSRLAKTGTSKFRRAFGRALFAPTDRYPGVEIGMKLNFPGEMWHMRLLGHSTRDKDIPHRLQRTKGAKVFLEKFPIKTCKCDNNFTPC